MSSEEATSPPAPPRGGLGGFLKRAWYSILVVINAGFWNMFELLTPHRKFDVKKMTRRPEENVVVTGGARGIGKEIVRKLLMLDMNVILGVRNESAAKTMVEEFRKAQITTGTVDIFPLDLKSFASVKEFANKVVQKYNKIQLLINNAGVYDLPYEITEDGYEVTFQVNYLSHFLLTNMLIPKLTYAGTAENTSRIVNVSSVAHFPGKLNLDDLWMEKVYGSDWAYGNSKLMQAVSSKDLNDRLVKDGYPIRSFAVHPGCVDSGLYNSYPKIIRALFGLMFKKNEQGADGVLYVAISPDVENDGGKYFQNCRSYFTNRQVNNANVQKKLWEASCKATGWQDTLSSGNKGSRHSLRKNAPSIVVTNDATDKITKDDLEKEGDNNPGSSRSGNGSGDIPTKVGGSE